MVGDYWNNNLSLSHNTNYFINTFKDIAYQILQEVSRPLHSNEITKIALERGWLKTAGITPEATMHAKLITDTK
jgi:hypothetical protein